jgi:prephenate dehydratase
MKIAYQGEPGAYSEDAVASAFPGSEPVSCETVRAAFALAVSGGVEFSVVPMENSQAGSINETYDLLLHEERLRIVGEVVVRVDHALLGVPGATLKEINRVYSHPQALAQSEEFLAELHAEIVPVLDTAGAARKVAEAGKPQEAAVASVRAGELQGLTVLAERIQTHKENFTKFVVVGDHQPGGAAEADRTSLVFAVADKPGSLFACLEPYAREGINLTKLESRPRPGAPFEYVFYMDLEAGENDPRTARVFEDMRPHTSMLKVLGSYPAWREPAG